MKGIWKFEVNFNSKVMEEWDLENYRSWNLKMLFRILSILIQKLFIKEWDFEI